jgi:hypothetical protein
MIRRDIVVYVELAMLMALLMVLAGQGQAHDGWTDRYKSASGTKCCTMNEDCEVAHVRVLAPYGDVWRIEINGREWQVPAKSVHPSEEEGGRDVVCGDQVWVTGQAPYRIPRCVFLAPGS